MLARIRDSLPDDLLVAQVHAVKHANGQADLLAAMAQIFCGVDEFHEGALNVKWLKR
jgi:hypothetical protein